MAKNHIVFLTDEEVKVVANLCQAALTMGRDSEYFKKMEVEAKSVLEKMREKMGD